MQAFLTASWKHLIFINYEVDSNLLLPYLPKETELDFYNGKCLVSLVGFMFVNTKIRGIGVPFHRNFEEFNLRFYVKRKEGESYKRGVVFIKEIVPRRMISFVAYLLYGESYFYHPMKHRTIEAKTNIEVAYSFYVNKKWNGLKVVANKEKQPIFINTEEEFITEHYWGYTRLKNGATSEYNVQHPRWNLYPVNSYEVDVNADELYGKQWHEYLSVQPTSVLLADGSPVIVFTRNIIM